MTAKADTAIQNLSELEEILSTQKAGDPAILKEVTLKVKQFKESLIKELEIANQSKTTNKIVESVSDIHKNQKYKNLSGSVNEIFDKLYKK